MELCHIRMYDYKFLLLYQIRVIAWYYFQNILVLNLVETKHCLAKFSTSYIHDTLNAREHQPLPSLK